MVLTAEQNPSSCDPIGSMNQLFWRPQQIAPIILVDEPHDNINKGARSPPGPVENGEYAHRQVRAVDPLFAGTLIVSIMCHMPPQASYLPGLLANTTQAPSE
jgi:hypothetical protein